MSSSPPTPPPSTPPHFCCDQLSQTQSSAAEIGSLLQIESSLPARAAKPLLTALQPIIAALSHSECRLDFHYNARCHSCFSFGAPGLLEKLEPVAASSSLKNTQQTYLLLRSIDFRRFFATFKGCGFTVSGKHVRAALQQLYEDQIDGLCGQRRIVSRTGGNLH